MTLFLKAKLSCRLHEVVISAAFAEDGVAQGCLHKPRWLAFRLISFEATLEETLDAWM